MYVVCHKCEAAYVVEDRLVVGAGARAQCPNCLHVQAVGTGAASSAAPRPVGVPPIPPVAALASDPQAFRIPAIPPVSSPVSPEPVIRDSSPPPAAVAATARAVCRDCRAPLTDPFDRALGICESCRTGAIPSAPIASAETSQANGHSDEFNGVLTGSGYEDPPDDSELESGGSLPFAGDADEADPKASTGHLPERGGRDPNRMISSSVASPARWRGGRILIAVVFIAALAVAGTMVRSRRRPQVPVKAPVAVTVPLSAALEKSRQRWSADFAGLKGDAQKLLTEGDAALARDTPSGYEDAARAFQQAFLLEAGNGNGQAVAGYLQAVAWGRGATLGSSEVEEMISLAEAAELQWGRSARILVAHASLALLGPQSSRTAERARSFAEQAVGLASGRDKALAHLVLSSAFLSSSAELAIQQIELALKLDPALRRVYLHRALARESLGDYATAISDLEKRLSLDPDQWEARAALSRIYQEVGQLGLAYRLYEPAANGGSDLRAATARALIQYQSERKPRAAAQTLSDGIGQREHQEQPPLLAEAWVHLASAERVAGRLESAATASKRALDLAPGDPAPHLQLFLIALSRGSADEATKQLALFKRRLSDPALEKLLEGRLLLLQRHDAEAMRIFADAAQLDGRRLDALLLAGAAAASAGRRDDTLRYLLLAGQMDPTRLGPMAIPTRFYLGPEENLAGAQGRVVRLSKGYTDVTPRLYEALILFHQRNWAAADRLLRQVVDVDVGNALAHALRAMIALNRGSLRAARNSAERAVASGRGVALAHFAYATVMYRSGNLEAARREFGQAETLAPALLAAQVSLAEMDAKKKSTDAARRRLVHVLRVDPSYVAAKRALYNLER